MSVSRLKMLLMLSLLVPSHDWGEEGKIGVGFFFFFFLKHGKQKILVRGNFF